MFPIVTNDSDYQVACVGDLGAGSCISVRNIIFVDFREEVFEKQLETGLQKEVLLQANINDLSSSLSSFSPLVC